MTVTEQVEHRAILPLAFLGITTTPPSFNTYLGDDWLRSERLICIMDIGSNPSEKSYGLAGC
jgi:hypothetical protein